MTETKDMTMRSILTSALEVAGAGLSAYGLWLAWPPLGVVAAGVSMTAFGYLAGGER